MVSDERSLQALISFREIETGAHFESGGYLAYLGNDKATEGMPNENNRSMFFLPMLLDSVLLAMLATGQVFARSLLRPIKLPSGCKTSRSIKTTTVTAVLKCFVYQICTNMRTSISQPPI